MVRLRSTSAPRLVRMRKRYVPFFAALPWRLLPDQVHLVAPGLEVVLPPHLDHPPVLAVDELDLHVARTVAADRVAVGRAVVAVEEDLARPRRLCLEADRAPAGLAAAASGRRGATPALRGRRVRGGGRALRGRGRRGGAVLREREPGGRRHGGGHGNERDYCLTPGSAPTRSIGSAAQLGSLLFLGPTELAVGLALKEQRYGRIADSPLGHTPRWFPRSRTLSAPGFGIAKACSQKSDHRLTNRRAAFVTPRLASLSLPRRGS